MTAYYNEIDPFAAAWLGRLIAGGHIASGVVDTRSIEDVTPSDLEGFTQCHFFAGIGVWSYALRRGGWSDDRPVWTGSCPCQPFSAAGKGGGFTDERHLWPAWFHLIESCGPAVVIGEQVASKDGLAWLDLVRADMEGTGRAFGAADLCAAGLGAPHIRQRSWWVGLADAAVRDGRRGECRAETGIGPDDQRRRGLASGGHTGGLADADHARLERRGGMPERADKRVTGADGMAVGLADAGAIGCSESGERQASTGSSRAGQRSDAGNPGPTNGFWRNADWLFCRDGKWRPVEPGAFPLVNGAPNRVGRLRGYGNAIAAPVAQAFIETVMSCL